MTRFVGHRPIVDGGPRTPDKRVRRFRRTSRSRWRPILVLRKCFSSSRVQTGTPSSIGSAARRRVRLARDGSSSSWKCSRVARRCTRNLGDCSAAGDFEGAGYPRSPVCGMARRNLSRQGPRTSVVDTDTLPTTHAFEAGVTIRLVPVKGHVGVTSFNTRLSLGGVVRDWT